MKIFIIDGQGGKLGRLLVEQLKSVLPDQELTAIGTNSIATAAMLRAGADQGATGENPVILAAKSADIIAGPLGIVVANSLLGEVTPAMAAAIGESSAMKVLIPMNKCSTAVVGVREMPYAEYVHLAAKQIAAIING